MSVRSTGPGVRRGELGVLVAASWAMVRRRGLVAPAAAALVVVGAASPALDDGYALQVLRGISLLLACGLAAAADDPAGEVLAASPYPRCVRSGVRVLAALAVVLPVWLVSAVVVEVRSPGVPVAGLGVEALALAGVALAVGFGLRAWRDQHTPSSLTMVGVVGFAFATAVAPRWYALQQSQTWGPPWQAAQFRWAGLLLVALGIGALALRDPSAGRDRDVARSRSSS